MSLKILIYHMRFHPDLTGTAPLVTQLAIDLAARNNQVTVIASLPHYGRSDIHPDFRDKQGFFHDAMYEGVRVIRTPVFVPSRPLTYLRILNYLSYTLFSVIAGLKVDRSDIVLAINPPITTSYSAWVMALWHRAPLVVTIQDVWPEVVVTVGQLRSRVLIWLSQLLERVQYSIATRVVVLSKEMKHNLEAKGVRAKKIAIISNWADLERIKPLEDGKAFRKANKLEGRFVVLFAGNLGYVASLHFVVEAAKLLCENRDVVFLFVGEGSVKNDLVMQARNLNLENVQFLTTQPEELLPDMLAAADVGLVVLNKGLGELSVPSKTFALMAAGKPILAAVPEDSEIKRLVENADCGFWVAAQTPQKLAVAVLELRNSNDKLKQMGMNGREYLEKNLTRETQTAAYLSLLSDAVTTNQKASRGNTTK